MISDVAGAERAQYCVGERVQPGIGIGMADQRLLVRHAHAAQPDVIAGPERMHVEALAGADVGLLRGEVAAGAIEVGSGGDLEIRRAALDQAHREAGTLGHRRVVGQIAAGGGAMGGENLLVGEPRWRSGARHSAARSSVAASPRAALHRVGERQGRDGGRRVGERGQHPIDGRGIDGTAAAS